MDLSIKHQHGRALPAAKRHKPDDLSRPTHVRVVATEEKYRRALQHGVTRQKFLPNIGDSVEWPLDSFTWRRLREGTVKLADDAVAEAIRAPQAHKREDEGERTTHQRRRARDPQT